MILAIDATGSTCSVAILQQAIGSPSLAQNSYSVVGERTLHNGLTHSVNLLPMIDQVFTETGTTLSQITALAVSQGPGSFTGVRIGISTAKALAHRYHLPVIAVPTLDGLACNLLTDTHETSSSCLAVPIMDARRAQVYGAIYDIAQETHQLRRTSDYLSIGIQNLIKAVREQAQQKGYTPAQCVFLGDGVPVHQELLLSHGFTVLADNNGLQQAVSIGKLSHRYPVISYQVLVPFYVRKPQAVREMLPVFIEPLTPEMSPTAYQLLSESMAHFWSCETFVADTVMAYSHYVVALKIMDGKQHMVGVMGFHHNLDHVELIAIAVHPDYRGESIGERLLHHLHDYAKAHHVATISLEVRAGNLVARNFYHKQGYTFERIRSSYYRNPTENAVILSRVP